MQPSAETLAYLRYRESDEFKEKQAAHYKRLAIASVFITYLFANWFLQA